MQVHTRSEAIKLGLKKFYTGRPCKAGHLAMRYTMSGSCEKCIAEHYGKVQKLMNDKKALTTVMYSNMHPEDAMAANAYIESLIAARKLSEGASTTVATSAPGMTDRIAQIRKDLFGAL